MSEHKVDVLWQRAPSEVFVDQKYSRAHTWSFDGGARIAASASPDVVPVPLSVPENVDPEEAFIAAVSSCHMLWFLGIAAEQRWVVNSYHDHATGILRRNSEGRLAITDITLRPRIEFENAVPSLAQIRALHDNAHHRCFIANSIRTNIHVDVIPGEQK